MAKQESNKDPVKAMKAKLGQAEKTYDENPQPYWKGKVKALQDVVTWLEENPQKQEIVYKNDLKKLIIAFLVGQAFQAFIVYILWTI